jgi:PTS system N-acetylglucosamine-specific IIC component
VDEDALKSLGAAGLLRPTAETLQVVIGLRADEIASNMRKFAGNAQPSSTAETVVAAPDTYVKSGSMPASLAPSLIAALGGAGNIRQIEAFGPRLSLLLDNTESITAGALLMDGFRGFADLGEGRVQVLADGDLGSLAQAVKDGL